MGGRAQVNKQHKTRFSSKATRQVHKTIKDKSSISKSEPNGGKGARASRKQRNKMVQMQKCAAVLGEKKASSGSTSSPRVILLFGLSASVNLNSLEDDLLALLSSENSGSMFPTVACSDYKLRITILKAPHGDLLSCVEMAKVADMIAFVVSEGFVCKENASCYIDSFGAQCLSVFRSLGLPSTTVLIRNLPAELKRRNDPKKMCIDSLSSELPKECKFHLADTMDELKKFMNLFKEQRLTVPHWRNQRPYLMALKVDIAAEDQISGKCTLLLTGFMRAHSLLVNQLVHVAGAGDFQLSKIETLKDPFSFTARIAHDLMDSDEVHDLEVLHSLIPDPLRQEPLLVENIPDPHAADQTWPTEAEMAEADENIKQNKHKKRGLEPGMSEYQRAWMLGVPCEEYSYSSNDEDNHSMILDEDSEVDPMILEDENLTREQIEADIQKIKNSHAEDEEYPDEVDTPLDVPAKIRFAKYRGLKSMRSSPWDPKESLPLEYSRIFEFSNFARTQKDVLANAFNMDQGHRDDCVPANTYVRLHVKDVPVSVGSKLCELAKTVPVTACGLLQHESKMSVLHFRIKKHDTYTEPIKGKEELIFHVGFRQFIARPIFASDNFNSDKHKMEKFLHAGRFSLASIYAPVTFPSLPLIAFKRLDGGATSAVAAVGSLTSIDPDKIILKKIILTGYPQRVSKTKSSVRYMFHNPEDVAFFKPVEVCSKFGRRGRILEPVGTHGAMKCKFNGVLQQNDTVCMSLYKRTFPKWPEHRFPIRDT